jgi:exonuclease 3'-5' domain-containing protein 1
VDIFVSENSEVSEMVDVILTSHYRDSAALDLHLDTEGDAVTGALSLIQVYIASINTVYILDVLTLGQAAFTTPGSEGQTSGDVLESKSIRKSFFGVDQESSLLFKFHNIRLANVTDLALMGIACNDKRKERNVSLADAVKKCRKRCWVSGAESKEIDARKAWGKTQFNLAEVKVKAGEPGYVPLLNQRPLTEEVREYAIWDVLVMPVVYKLLDDILHKLKHPFSGLDERGVEEVDKDKYALLLEKRDTLGYKTWSELVADKTQQVLDASQTEGYDAQEAYAKGEKGVKEWSDLAF